MIILYSTLLRTSSRWVNLHSPQRPLCALQSEQEAEGRVQRGSICGRAVGERGRACCAGG